MLISLIGTIVAAVEFPKHYPSWLNVPSSAKTGIWPQIETYFDMHPWFSGPHSDVVRAGIEKICAERYSSAKYRFKKQFFTDRGGYENPAAIRNHPPSGVSMELWNQFVNAIMTEQHISRAESNSVNRSQQVHSSRHGSKSFVTRRSSRRDPATNEYALNYIDLYRDMHTDKGVWISRLAQSNYERMVEMRNQADGRSEQAIMDEVLGIRRGHHRGRGRKLHLSSSSSAPTSSKGKEVLMDNHIQSAFRQELSKYVKKLKAANPNMVFPENLDDDEDDEGTETEDAGSEDTRSEEDEASDN